MIRWMLTNPSTIGVFESQIHKIADILHAKGALLYMDGANMNALVGFAPLPDDTTDRSGGPEGQEAAGGQHGLELVRGGRPRQEIPLPHAAAQLPEKVKLIRPFDALGDHGKRELVGQPEDAFQHGHRWRGRRRGRGMARYEGAVDLEDVNGQAGQRAQG